jgi:D-glycero-D-manno-heptose 1,7-bisphosphate phosphatase
MKLVILDRDGVINEDSDNYIKSPEEWAPINGSLEAIARLNHFGFKVVIASNQSGLSRGLFTIEDLNAVHQKMRMELDRVGGQIEGIYFCPHGPDDDCDCRKPKIGLFKQIIRRLSVDIEGVPVVGDSLRDLQAGSRAGCRPMLVLTGKGMRTLRASEAELRNTPVFPDLAAAAEAIINTYIEP